jgi:hypothetical protein
MEFLKKHKNGIIGATLFHLLLLLVIIFMGFSTKLPLPGEEGMLINFGHDESGSGFIEPERVETSQKENTPINNTQENSNDNQKEILTQNFEESINIKTSQKINKTNNTNTQDVKPVEQTEESPREVNTKALFPGNSNSNNTSTSDGNTSGTGNQGSEDGSPNSKNYDGGIGNGNGISYSLAGRKPEALPKPEYNTQEEGKVVVDVTVDRYGNVVKAIPGVKGTTTPDKVLWASAKKAAEKTKFTKKVDAPEEQKGTITYHFILQ